MALSECWKWILFLAMTPSAHANFEPYATTTTPPCAHSKAGLEKADPRLKQAFAPYGPFEKRIWRGKSSDIHIDEKGAVVHVHKEFAALAKFFADEEPVQRIPIYWACLDLNNKPFLKIGRTEQLAVAVYLNEKSVTLTKNGNSDTFGIVLGSPATIQSADAGAAAPVPAKPQPVLN